MRIGLIKTGLIAGIALSALGGVAARAQDDEGGMHRHMMHRMMRHEMHREMMRHEMRHEMRRHMMHRMMRHEMNRD